MIIYTSKLTPKELIIFCHIFMFISISFFICYVHCTIKRQSHRAFRWCRRMWHSHHKLLKWFVFCSQHWTWTYIFEPAHTFDVVHLLATLCLHLQALYWLTGWLVVRQRQNFNVLRTHLNQIVLVLCRHCLYASVYVCLGERKNTTLAFGCRIALHPWMFHILRHVA